MARGRTRPSENTADPSHRTSIAVPLRRAGKLQNEVLRNRNAGLSSEVPYVSEPAYRGVEQFAIGAGGSTPERTLFLGVGVEPVICDVGFRRSLSLPIYKSLQGFSRRYNTDAPIRYKEAIISRAAQKAIQSVK